MKKMSVLLALVLMFVLSCGGHGNKGKELVLNLGTAPTSIDPQITTDIAGGTVDDLLMEGLLRKDKDGKSVPGIAEKWESTPDGLKWTFHLRDAKWSNGDPITANDFKAGWLRALDPKTGAENAYLLFMIKNAEEFNSGKATADQVGIKVVDPKTLVVELKTPTPYFDDLVTFKAYMPLNEKYYNQVKDKYFSEAKYTIAVGPYTLDDWTHNSELRLKKNPNYWDAANVKTENVVLKMIDSNSSVNAFKNDEVDVTPVTFEQAKEFNGKPELVTAKDGGIYYLTISTKFHHLQHLLIQVSLCML